MRALKVQATFLELNKLLSYSSTADIMIKFGDIYRIIPRGTTRAQAQTIIDHTSHLAIRKIELEAAQELVLASKATSRREKLTEICSEALNQLIPAALPDGSLH